MIRPAPTLLVLLFFVLLVAACARTKNEPASQTTQRIISISPAMTESLFALGAGPSVIAVSRYCDYPASVAQLPKVGGFLDPSLEAILALRPTLVVGHRSPSNRGVVDTLEQQHIRVFFPEQERLAGLRATFTELGALTSTQPRARELIQNIDAQLARIAANTLLLNKPRVLLLYGIRPLTAAGPNTFANEMLTHAGAVNALTSGPEYATLGDEQLITLAPEVILVSDMGEGEMTFVNEPRFASIHAIKNHRVTRLDDARIMRPGPRIAEGVALLAHAIHGSRFVE